LVSGAWAPLTKGSPVPQIATEDVRPRLLGDALRRYWAVLLVCAVGLAIAGGLFASTRPTSYVASARVLLRPTIGNPLGPDNATSGQQVTIAMQTEATLVDSDPVAALSNASLTNKWKPGGGTVHASVPPNTQVLLITFKARSARAAQAGAQSVADNYLAYRKAQSAATVKARSDVLTKQVATVTTKLTAAEKAQTSTSTTASTNAARQIQLLTSQLVSLQDTLSGLQGTDTAPGSVLSPATLPSKAAGIGPQVIIAVGALLGLLAGLVLAIALTRSDKRVRRSAVMVEDVPVLSVLGARRRLFAGRSSDHPQRGLRSSYQRLRIGALAAVPPSSSIALSALGENDHVGDVAAELGSSFTRAGYHVVIVLATPEQTALDVLDVNDEAGLSDVLAGAANATDVLLDRGGVQVLAPGQDIEEVQERLSGDRFKAVLRELAETCDYVLVVGPLATTPSGVAVGRASTAMLLVGREMRTTSIDVEDATDRAELVGAHVIGLVLRSRERRSFSLHRHRSAPPASGAATPSRGADPTTMAPAPTAYGSEAVAPVPSALAPSQRLPVTPPSPLAASHPNGATRDAVAIATSAPEPPRAEDEQFELHEDDVDEFTYGDGDAEPADEDTELADLDEDAELADLDEDVVIIMGRGLAGSGPSATSGE
jgi:succinoglycan biosynthesis transport protein ExoP